VKYEIEQKDDCMPDDIGMWVVIESDPDVPFSSEPLCWCATEDAAFRIAAAMVGWAKR